MGTAPKPLIFILGYCFPFLYSLFYSFYVDPFVLLFIKLPSYFPHQIFGLWELHIRIYSEKFLDFTTYFEFKVKLDKIIDLFSYI